MHRVRTYIRTQCRVFIIIALNERRVKYYNTARVYRRQIVIINAKHRYLPRVMYIIYRYKTQQQRHRTSTVTVVSIVKNTQMCGVVDKIK